MILIGVPRDSCEDLPAGLVWFGEAVGGNAALDDRQSVNCRVNLGGCLSESGTSPPLD